MMISTGLAYPPKIIPLCDRSAEDKAKAQSVQEAMYAKLRQILKRRENALCADCNAPRPCWTIFPYGIFCCANCAQIWRVDKSIAVTKGITTYMFFEDEVEIMDKYGNGLVNELLSPGVARMDEHADKTTRETYIRNKYLLKKWAKPVAVSSDSSASSSSSTRRSSAAESGSEASAPSPAVAPTSVAAPKPAPAVVSPSPAIAASKPAVVAAAAAAPVPNLMDALMNEPSMGSSGGNNNNMDLVSIFSQMPAQQPPMRPLQPVYGVQAAAGAAGRGAPASSAAAGWW